MKTTISIFGLKSFARPSIALIAILHVSLAGFGQVYEDFYGAGHNMGMNTTSSSDGSETNDLAQNSVSGAVDELSMEEASRFLAQASLGASFEQIQQVRDSGLEEWFAQQTDMPIPQTFQSRLEEIYQEVLQMQNNENPNSKISDFVFYEMTFEQEDLLRQRMAFAWSQIIVVAEPRNGISEQLGFARYYDILYGNAFGNFRDMLYEVSTCIAMGTYLSSYNNRKFDPNTGSEPDENFAREIMQLFTIGTQELDINGNSIVDPTTGGPKETYGIEDVAELAKVFTGLTASTRRDGSANTNGLLNQFNADRTKPMTIIQNYHDEGEKNFLGKTIPAGQSGMQDLNDAIDYLFNHPNTGPFLALRLIQHLVKSNPSPAYVGRVARTFNDNGSGIRGDLKAVTRAILFDPEARECDYIYRNDNGKLIQPMERLITLFKAFDVSTPSGKFFLNDNNQIETTLLQGFNNSPSVFNFFQFDFAEQQRVAPNNLVSPEFQILNSNSSIGYINLIENAIKRHPFENQTRTGGNVVQNNVDDRPSLDFTQEIQLYQDEGLEALLDRLNILLCRGALTNEIRNLITTTVENNLENVNNYDETRVIHDCLYYIMISPDFMIQL